MKKLIEGIKNFRAHKLSDYQKSFSKLADRQNPDTLFIACSDSRVVPNLFASTDPGDLFVIRNVGNLIPSCTCRSHASNDTSAWAAIEFSLLHLNVSDIIVCGHSECGAVAAIMNGTQTVAGDHLKSWLIHGNDMASMLEQIDFSNPSLTEQNKLSQANVLLQLEHLKTYPLIQDRLAAKKIAVHGWWFDIRTGDVYYYEPSTTQFTLIA